MRIYIRALNLSVKNTSTNQRCNIKMLKNSKHLKVLDLTTEYSIYTKLDWKSSLQNKYTIN